MLFCLTLHNSFLFSSFSIPSSYLLIMASKRPPNAGRQDNGKRFATSKVSPRTEIVFSTMQDCYQMTMEGKPHALGRPRFTSHMKDGVHQSHVYSPDKKLIQQVQAQLKQVIEDHTKQTAPLFPKGKKIQLCVYFSTCTHMGRTADLDNLLKFIMEVGSKVLYDDDEQIWRVVASKSVSSNSLKTTLSIKELPSAVASASKK
jgi:Holliday junction resolvase RusA-like endonuclease